MSNRKQRRSQGIKQKTKTYTLTDVQIRQLKEKARKDAIDTAFILMLSIPTMALRDKFGFGKTRLERFTDATLDLYTAFNEDYVTLEDLVNTLKEETGITLSYNDIEVRGGSK